MLALFGKGDLAKARKELTSKDEELARFQAKITKLEAEKVSLKQKYESDIAKLKNGYQKEIDTAIRHAEIAEWKAAEKDAVIERQKNRIEELDRKANPSAVPALIRSGTHRLSLPWQQPLYCHPENLDKG